MSQEKTPTPSPATNLNVNNLKDLKEAKTEAELKQELTMLKTQVSELMKEIKRISEKGVEHLGDKIEREFEQYSEKAADKVRDAQHVADLEWLGTFFLGGFHLVAKTQGDLVEHPEIQDKQGRKIGEQAGPS